MDIPKWPENGQPVEFENLVEPICEALRFAYAMQRQNRELDIPYNGYEIGQERSNAPSAYVQLKADRLAYAEQEQGRDAMTEIVSLAIRLGIEQGRRIFQNSSEYQAMKIYADLYNILRQAPK